ncbi:MAG: T9SS type A sorting domain-containing protein, partial [Candidatus Latescibacteria bacterium]|nr:T9SS type A sorting domain-containing protein [Candidatus Latescibacterota bacterium]
SATCGTPIALEIREGLRRLSAESAVTIKRLLSRRRLQYSYVTPGGHFRVHYDADPPSPNGVERRDDDRNTVPDYIDIVAATFDSVWRLQIDRLGYHPPLMDRGAGGGDEYDIYVVELGGTNVYGYTYPDGEGPEGQTSTSYIEIDNDYRGGVYNTSRTRGLDALRVTAAHEFFHAIQFSYYDGRDGIWWQEATATWMEDVAYTEVNDYYQYLRYFFQDPTLSLDRATSSQDYHVFGATIFPHFLSERFDRSVIRRTWENFAKRQSATIKEIGEGIPVGFDSAMIEFTLWNYFTGKRHRNGYYPEGGAYPEVPTQPMDLSGEMVRGGSVDHLGADYVRIEPRGRPGGLRVQFNVDERVAWRMTFLLITRDSVEVLRDDRRVLLDWQRYQEIVVIPLILSRQGAGYQYSYTATYDSGLTKQPAPKSFVLKPIYPNPFRPIAGQVTTISFNLPEPANDVRITIYSITGQKVREFLLGDLSAFSYTKESGFTWDGRDQAGRFVAPGVYFYRLDAGRFSESGRLTVLSATP